MPVTAPPRLAWRASDWPMQIYARPSQACHPLFPAQRPPWGRHASLAFKQPRSSEASAPPAAHRARRGERATRHAGVPCAPHKPPSSVNGAASVHTRRGASLGAERAAEGAVRSLHPADTNAPADARRSARALLCRPCGPHARCPGAGVVVRRALELQQRRAGRAAEAPQRVRHRRLAVPAAAAGARARRGGHDACCDLHRPAASQGVPPQPPSPQRAPLSSRGRTSDDQPGCER